jgi:hypothetical protein
MHRQMSDKVVAAGLVMQSVRSVRTLKMDVIFMGHGSQEKQKAVEAYRSTGPDGNQQCPGAISVFGTCHHVQPS